MSFTDMIKKSVLEGFNAGDLSTSTILTTLIAAVVLGLYIYVVYRLTSKGGFYNRGFNKSLATLPLITAGIMLAMQSNLVISLGMVGALSIVRFRNAVKDPADLTYLFWSISIGIITGAGLYELAILISLCATLLVVGLDLLPSFRAPCILVVTGEDATQEKELLACIRTYYKSPKVRSRNCTKRGCEWIIELQAKKAGELIQAVSALEGISSANLMTHDGEVRF